MRYLALATDYDGTLALHGRVDAPTIAALEALRASGRKLIMVTGRELDELLGIFPQIGLFDWVVAENGGLLYQPSTRIEKKLAESPPPKFVDELKRRGVGPISVGRVIVATWEPHETTCLQVIRDMALELEIIFNKGAVMILPTGVNKATGLRHALEQLGLSVHNVVGTGDAENDHAFLSICECGAAMSNALPALKDRADVVTAKDHGAGVCEIIEAVLEDDLTQVSRGISRHHIPLGKVLEGGDVMLRPHGRNILVAGTSGGGKSSAATGVLERLIETSRQLVVIDPEGEYDNLEGALTLGNAQRAPSADEILELLGKPGQNVTVNLLGMKLEDRPVFFRALLPRLQELRIRTGRPHWIAVDEAHHVLPVAWEPAALGLPVELRGMIFITVHPSEVSLAALKSVDTVIATGKQPEATIAEFLQTIGEESPALAPSSLERGEVLYFSRAEGGMPQRVTTKPAKTVRKRHVRKYAEGDLGHESFYFKGPENKLNLQAQNLMMFMQMADGVDDETWLFHLQANEYSQWFRDAIKDEPLAVEAAQIEGQDLTPAASRQAFRELIQRHYTAPAAAPAVAPVAAAVQAAAE